MLIIIGYSLTLKTKRINTIQNGHHREKKNTFEGYDEERLTAMYCYQSAGHIVNGDLKIITDSRIQSFICKGLKYKFPLQIDFKICRKEITGTLQDFCYLWCKQEHVESNALNRWKLNIF